MNRNKTLTLAAAALSGMLAGSAARAAVIATSATTGNGSSQLLAGAGQKAITVMDDAAKHDCKGQNSCKGTGGCKTGDGGCKGQNTCKGKGGCKTATPTTAPGL